MVTCVIRRNITDHLLQALADTPVVLINGARQTGKSTLVQSREVADERSRQYLTFDDPGVLAAARRDPNGFLAGLTTPVTLEALSLKLANWQQSLTSIDFKPIPLDPPWLDRLTRERATCVDTMKTASSVVSLLVEYARPSLTREVLLWNTLGRLELHSDLSRRAGTPRGTLQP